MLRMLTALFASEIGHDCLNVGRRSTSFVRPAVDKRLVMCVQRRAEILAVSETNISASGFCFEGRDEAQKLQNL